MPTAWAPTIGRVASKVARAPELPRARGASRDPAPEPRETLTPVHFDEPGELALLANRILAVVQTRLDNGGRLTDDDLVTEIEAVLRDHR